RPPRHQLVSGRRPWPPFLSPTACLLIRKLKDGSTFTMPSSMEGASWRLKGEKQSMRVSPVCAALFGTVAAAALFTTPAAAQDNPTSAPPSASNEQTQAQAATGSDQEIVVTARRRNEILLDVPVAV